MGDAGYLALMVAFMVLAVAFAFGGDKIIRPDEPALSDAERDVQPADEPSPRPAGTKARS